MFDRLYERLRRPTRSLAYRPELDGIRLIAILAVVVFHIGSTLVFVPGTGIGPQIVHAGHWGVQLFFVLSGFVLGLPFARARLGQGERPALGAFYLRRLTRLEPPYLLSLAFMWGLIVVFDRGRSLAVLPNVVAGALYVHGPVFGSLSPVHAAAWSLEVEAQFYLLVPLLARLYSTRLLMPLALAALLLRLGLGPSRPLVELTVLGWLPYFLVGMWVAEGDAAGWWGHLSGNVVSASGAALSLILMALPPWAWEALPLAFGLLVLGATRPGTFRSLLSRRGIALLGGMSYSVYLWHLGILWFVGKGLRRVSIGSWEGQTVVGVLVGVPAVFAISALLYALVERPCMDPAWTNRLRARLRRA